MKGVVARGNIDSIKTLLLTLLCNEALEINGDCHPHGLAIILRPETPHADTQGARLGCQACKEKWLFCEVVGLPTLAFICGKPGDENKLQNY